MPKLKLGRMPRAAGLPRNRADLEACAPPMTFEVNGKQYLAITSGPSTAAKAKLVNTPELKEQRNATVLYVFAL
jgi:hypothetical protein